MRIKRITALFMCIIMCIGLIHVDVQAEPADEGTVTWDLAADGTLTISGDGMVGEDAFVDNKDITSIIIKEGVVGIKAKAFANCTKVKTVRLPETLTTLNGAAFANCTGLTEITIPSSVAIVEKESYDWENRGPFYNCTNLKKVIFAGTRKEIPAYIMQESGVSEIEWPKKVEKIGEASFLKCTKLSTVIMPETITEIDNSAFAEDSALSRVELSESLTKVHGAAFANCTSLTEITIPSSVTTVERVSYDWNERGPFYNCTNLKKVTFAGTRKEIPAYIMQESGVSEIEWPEKIEKIGDSSFLKCTKLASVIMPDTVTEIDNSAFAEDTALSMVKLSEGLTKVHGAAFANCTSLTEITIPSSVTTVERVSYDWNERGPFYNCTNLKKVIFAGTRKEIPAYIMQESGVSEIEWPKEVEKTGDSCFLNCTKLGTVVLPETITEISDATFKGCTSLESIRLSKNLKIVDSAAFAEDTKLKQIDLPEGLTTINGAAFANCTSLTEITIPSSVTTVNRVSYNWSDVGPFYNCSNLKTITFSGVRSSIPEYICQGSAVTWINWPKNIKTIGNSSFSSCNSLDSVVIPNSVTKIDDWAFYGCNILYDVKMSDTIETIGNYTFANCKSLEKLILPKSLKEIGDNSFDNCTSLSEIYFQKKLTRIGYDAFKDDNNLEAFAPKYSDATVLLIDKGINMSFSDSYHIEETTDVIDWTSTSYDMSDTSASGYIPMVLKYAIKEKYKDKVTDMELIFPDSMIEAKVNGTQVEFTSDNNGHNIIPISKTSGTVVIYTMPNDYGKVVSYAKLKYKNSGTDGNILMGAISERTSCLTLGINDKVSYEEGATSVKVEINGFAIKQKEVDIYVDDTSVGTVNASLNGIYKSEITLQSPEDYKKYTIKAVSVNNVGQEVTVEKNIYTVLEAPELTEAVLNLDAHEYKNGNADFNLLEDGEKIKYITFQPGKKYQFRLNYTHADRLNKVFVVSTRNGARKMLEAKWNSAAQAYITDGYFDNDSSYVPGNISVEYVLNEKMSTVSNDGTINLTKKEYAKIPDKWKNATVKENTNSSSDYEAEIILGDGDAVVYTHDEMSFTEFANVLRSEYINGTGPSTVAGSFLGTPSKASSSASSVVMTQSNISDLIDILEKTGDTGEGISDLYSKLKSFGFVEYITGEADINEDVRTLLKFDYSGEDIVSYIIDPSECGNNIHKYVFKRAKGSVKKSIVEIIGDKATGNFAYTMGGNIFDFEKATINLLWARTEILADPTLTEAQRQAKLAELDKMRDIACEKLVMQYFSATLMLVGAATSVTGVAVAAIVLSKIIDKCIIPMIESGDFDKFIKGDISLRSMIIRWIIDPSGYVYEGVTTNRISEVKTTLYYKETEKSTNETLWNASEYGQDNPLYTDNEGCYAWDVPEGFWRVKYEKDGYDTIYSDWMPVPPPQTDVNIAMVPTAAPKVESINVYESYTIVAFDQYMDPATITNIELADSDDNKVEYTLSYDKSETDATGTVYAKSFTLKYKNKKITGDDTLSVTVPETVKSSGGKSVEKSQNKEKSQKDASLTISEMVHIKMGEKVEIPYSIKGADDAVISVEIANPDIAKFVSVESDASKNEGKIIVEGEVYGTTKMLVTLGNTGIEKNVEIKIDTYSAIEEPAQDDVGGDDYIPGDVNGNGTVNSTDVILVRRYIAGGYNVTINDKAADVNDDGTVNSTDVILIRRYIAGGYGVTLK